MFRRWTVIPCHPNPNQHPQIQKQSGSGGLRAPQASSRTGDSTAADLSCLGWAHLEKYVFFVPVVVVGLWCGRLQVNRPVWDPLWSWEAGWGCLARPLVELDKPRAPVKAAVWTKDSHPSCLISSGWNESFLSVPASPHSEAEQLQTGTCQQFLFLRRKAGTLWFLFAGKCNFLNFKVRQMQPNKYLDNISYMNQLILWTVQLRFFLCFHENSKQLQRFIKTCRNINLNPVSETGPESVQF